jgi:hypothetical protein
VNLKGLWKPVLLYTALLGLLTVGAVHLATRSGLLVLFVAGGGLVLVILSVGSAGPTDGGAFENAEGLDAQGGWTQTDTDAPVSLPLLCYGFGVFLWSSILLVTFYDILA